MLLVKALIVLLNICGKGMWSVGVTAGSRSRIVSLAKAEHEEVILYPDLHPCSAAEVEHAEVIICPKVHPCGAAETKNEGEETVWLVRKSLRDWSLWWILWWGSKRGCSVAKELFERAEAGYISEFLETHLNIFAAHDKKTAHTPT